MISSFADYALENDLGGEHYSDPDLTCREHPGRVEEYELERLRGMMIEMISQPEDFRRWFGRFATTPRHELDIARLQLPPILRRQYPCFRAPMISEALQKASWAVKIFPA